MSQHLNITDTDQFRSFLSWMVFEAGRSLSRTILVIACTLVVASLFIYSYTPSLYRNIAGPQSNSLIYGHLNELFGPDAASFHDYLQDTFGTVARVKGTFGSDQLYITDPRAMQEILVKEHDAVFRHPQFQYDFFAVTFGPELATATGAMHKAQRKVSRFHAISQELRDTLVKEIGDTGSRDTDVLYWCNATALELIGQAGLGHTFGLFQGVKSAYSIAIKEFLPTFAEVAPYRAFFSLVYNYLPPAALRRKLVDYAPVASVQRMKRIIDIQDEQAQEILSKKKEALRFDQSTKSSNDILSVVLKANSESIESDKLPDDQVLGQINALIFAGHETTSGALARILDLISQNPTIQDKLRVELSTISSAADYDEIHSLPYMDAVCREVLRLYPPALMLERQSNKEWTIPLRYPVKGIDGTQLNEIKVAKGTHIYLGLREANRCKETWGDDADIFRPDRWLDVLPQSVVEARAPGVYSSMMTFGAGPRACIGFKFSVLELKIVLSTLVRSFEFSPSATPVEWRFTGAMAPYVVNPKENGEKAQLPLRVTVIS